MHELSIAQNILEIVKDNVPDSEFRNIRTINIKIGELSGVVAESLEFCFQVITDDTELKGAKLKIENTPFTLKCNSCNKNTTNQQGIMVCSVCNSLDTEIISGTEMQIESIELN